MKRSFATTNLLVLLALLSACTHLDSSSAPLKRIVVFGDSNVDTGNLYRLSGKQVPAAPNWQGRNSNGPVVVEFLADDLGATLENYAVSGATTGAGNIVALLSDQLVPLGNTGVSWQVEQFVQTNDTAQNLLTPTDLVVLWAGSNDIFRVERKDTERLTRQIEQATGNIVATIKRLEALGGERFLVALRSPRDVLESDNDRNGIDLNQALRRALESADLNAQADLLIFDTYASIADMMRNPEKYGFKHTNELCVARPACATERYPENLGLANQHTNWDAAHKTTRVHRLMADQIIELLTDQRAHLD